MTKKTTDPGAWPELSNQIKVGAAKKPRKKRVKKTKKEERLFKKTTTKMYIEGQQIVAQAKRWYLEDNPNGMKTLTEDFKLSEAQARAIFEGTATLNGDNVGGMNFKQIKFVKVVNSNEHARKAPCEDCGQKNGARCIYRDKKSFKRYCCQDRAAMVSTAKGIENILKI